MSVFRGFKIDLGKLDEEASKKLRAKNPKNLLIQFDKGKIDILRSWIFSSNKSLQIPEISLLKLHLVYLLRKKITIVFNN